MGVRATRTAPEIEARPRGPGTRAAAVVFLLAFALLLANGRPIGSPEARGAASWVWRGILAVAGLGIQLDATGNAVVGKVVAALFAALAAAVLFAAVARRHPASDARWAALTLALATTLTSATQAFSAEPLATCSVAFALWLLVRGDDEGDTNLTAAAGLPLGLAVALQPTAAPLALVLLLAPLPRWGAVVRGLLWALPGAVLAGLVLRPERAVAPGAPWDLLALLASPAKGALVFAPAVFVGVAGVVRAATARSRRGWDVPAPSRALPIACGTAALVHLWAVALLGGWDEGLVWGPRLLAPAWPPLVLFLPEGLAALRGLGQLLVVLSFAIQALGALSYDGRWDRLHRGPAGELGEATWSARRCPIVFQVEESVARPALLTLAGGRLVVRERTLASGRTPGSFVSFSAGRPRPTGSDETMEAFRLEQGARVVMDRLELRGEGDGVGFQVRRGAWPRRLELRLVGNGRGVIAVRESRFWGEPRTRERTVSGPFRLRLPYRHAESGGPDVHIVLRSGGPVLVESVALVPEKDPENVIRLP